MSRRPIGLDELVRRIEAAPETELCGLGSDADLQRVLRADLARQGVLPYGPPRAVAWAVEHAREERASRRHATDRFVDLWREIRLPGRRPASVLPDAIMVMTLRRLRGGGLSQKEAARRAAKELDLRAEITGDLCVDRVIKAARRWAGDFGPLAAIDPAARIDECSLLNDVALAALLYERERAGATPVASSLESLVDSIRRRCNALDMFRASQHLTRVYMRLSHERFARIYGTAKSLGAELKR